MLIPTPRLLTLALAGVIPVVLSPSHDIALLVAAAWLLSLVLVAVLDGESVPVSQLKWTRGHDPKLSLGVANPVVLQCENAGDRALTFRVRDTVPQLLQPRGAEGSGTCAAGASWTLPYQVAPIQRGDFALGPVTARYRGVLGLVWRQRTHRFDDHARVYPNLLALSQYDAFLRRGHLHEYGIRTARTWGSGTELERLRDYSPDDEYRRINWKATARRHVPVVVEYETERSQNVILALDTGRMMSAKVPLEGAAEDVRPAQPLARLDYAVNAALMLSYVSQQVGDRVGLLAFSDRIVRFLAPRNGRGQFLAIADALYNLQPHSTEPDYAAAVTYLSSRVSKRSLIVMFTDISSPESGKALARSLAVAGKRHLPLVVTLRDPEVNEMAQEEIASVANVYERAVAAQWLHERKVVLNTLRTGGALTVDTSADAVSTDVINRYLEVKGRTRL